MKVASRQRWALSFADICLLMLGFFVILQARQVDHGKLAGGLRDAFHGVGPAPGRTEPAASLFYPGEALLRPDGRARLVALSSHAMRDHHAIRLESRGSDPAGSRLDRWELAAARTAAVARALAESGLDPAAIHVSIPELGGTGPQRLLIAEQRLAR